MVKNVTITNYVGDKVEYKIEGVDVYDNNGLLITEIDGLGPTGAEIVFTKLVGANGAIYNSGRLNQRNIVIHALFTWAKTTEEARLSSYKMFPIGKKLRFDVQTENRKAYTYGYVEKNEPNIFESQTSMMISVMCESAYFYDEDEFTETMINHTVPLFEFIYENEGHEPVTEMGDYSANNMSYFYNGSDGEIGFTMFLEASAVVTNPVITFTDTNQVLSFNTTDIYNACHNTFGGRMGDQLVFISEPGNKSFWFRRDGDADVNITKVLPKGTPWPKLQPGYNHFLYSADSGADDYIVYFRFNEQYDGV